MKRPNVLILYPDQMRADCLGAAGNPILKTPHIDRLSREGVRFENAFVAFPLCCPWRASLMTGRYPHSNGMCANHYPVPLDQPFMAELFRDAGYRAAYFGKWHLNGGLKHAFVRPADRLGFDTFVGFSRGHRYFGSIYYRGDDERPRTSERYEPDYQTDHLIEFIDECARDPGGGPFLAMTCYGIPHPPLVAPERYLALYSPDEVPVSSNTPDDPAFRERAREFLAKYYGLVACVDDNVGRVLECLDRTGLAEDTLVIFVSDHGEMAGEHGLWGKKTYYRAAMQVPMVVRYPARFPGGRVAGPLVDPSVDTMPTLLALCGIDVPDGVQGTSYLPLLAGEAECTRGEVFYEICREREGPEAFPVAERGVRTLEWLYVRTERGPTALFDLGDDPLETTNLVASDRHADVAARLDGILARHMARTGDDWGIEAKFPPPDFQSHADGSRYAEELAKRAIVEP